MDSERPRKLSDDRDVGPGVFGGHQGEWVRLLSDGSLRFISAEQLAAIEILKRGGDPCEMILPGGWPSSARSFEDL